MEKAEKGILLLLEEREDGILSNISLEVAGGACELARKAGCSLKTVVLDSGFEDWNPSAYSHAMEELIRKYDPGLLLCGSTPSGIGLAALLAARLGAAMIWDCIDADYEQGEGFVLLRPDPSGFVRQKLAGKSLAIASVRPGTFAEIQDKDVLPEPVRLSEKKEEDGRGPVSLIRTLPQKKQAADITKAGILVSGGRGVGSPEGFAQLKVLARLLGGEVACSRALIELGWADASMQVGQTGKAVHPEVYIACGISGAIQHVTGMKDSDLIIAVNKNPAAPIFDVADLGIVGNLENILPALIKRLQEKKGDTNAI